MQMHAKLNQARAFQYDSWLRTLSEVVNIFEARYYQEIDISKDIFFIFLIATIAGAGTSV